MPAQVKLKANAPQAIIMEVLSSLCSCGFLNITIHLLYDFTVAVSRVSRTDLQRN